MAFVEKFHPLPLASRNADERQTDMDTTQRAGAWIGTLNNPTEEERIALRTQQRWMKTCKGQDEIGAQGTLHVQFVVTTDWIRMSTLKKWINRAHFEPCRGQTHVTNAMNYVHKSETAVPHTQFNYVWRGETERLSTNQVCVALYKMYDEIPHDELQCRLRGLAPDDDWREATNFVKPLKPERLYYHVMSQYLTENPEHVNIFGNRVIKELWLNCLPAIRSWWETDRQTTLAVNLAETSPTLEYTDAH